MDSIADSRNFEEFLKNREVLHTRYENASQTQERLTAVVKVDKLSVEAASIASEGVTLRPRSLSALQITKNCIGQWLRQDCGVVRSDQEGDNIANCPLHIAH